MQASGPGQAARAARLLGGAGGDGAVLGQDGGEAAHDLHLALAQVLLEGGAAEADLGGQLARLDAAGHLVVARRDGQEDGLQLPRGEPGGEVGDGDAGADGLGGDVAGGGDDGGAEALEAAHQDAQPRLGGSEDGVVLPAAAVDGGPQDGAAGGQDGRDDADGRVAGAHEGGVRRGGHDVERLGGGGLVV